MKTRILLLVLLVIIMLQACNRAMSPYEAANGSHKGRRCATIR